LDSPSISRRGHGPSCSARLDAHFGVDPPVVDRAQARSLAASLGDISIAVYDLSAIERDRRAFELQR
jgi:hypothetical protein